MKKIGWYDVKTKFKHVIRSILYSVFFQKLICLLICNYMRLVIITSKKTFYNLEYVNELIKNGNSFIAATWHNRISMTPFVFSKSYKINKDYIFSALTSSHGDGKIVGKIIEYFGLTVISGSTRKERDPSKGIAVSNFRKIFKILKNSAVLCITPDGPRGPKFKVSGQVAAIAKIAKVPIVPVSFGISRRKVFNSWDRFVFPLPFSKIAFYYGKPIYVDKNTSDKDLEKINKKIEKSISLACQKSDELVGATPIID